MNEAIMKYKIMEYGEGMITPAHVETASLLETIQDEYGETNIWLLESDTGEEYYVLEGDFPANIYKKSGIYENYQHVYDTYIEASQPQEQSEMPDRFTYL